MQNLFWSFQHGIAYKRVTFKKCASNYKMNTRAMRATVHRCIKSYLKAFPTL